MSGAMKVELIVDDKGTVKIKRFGKTVHESALKGKEGMASLNAAFKDFKARLVPTTGLVTKLGAAFGLWRLKAAIDDFKALSSVQEKAEAGMVQAMKSMGRHTEEFEQRIYDTATALQGLSTIGDENILMGAKFLMTYKQISDDVMPRTMAAMTDLAALMGGDTKQAANMLGKASMGMTGELRRAGITVDEDTFKMQGFLGVLKEIEDQVKGQAAALRATKSGGLEAFGNVVDDVKEKFGLFIETVELDVKTFFLPSIMEMDKHLQDLKKSGDLSKWAHKMAQDVLEKLEWIVTGAAWVKDAFWGWQMVWEGLKIAFNAFGLVITRGLEKLLAASLKVAKALGADETAFSIAKGLREARIASGWFAEGLDQALGKLDELAGQRSAHEQVAELFDEMKAKAEAYAKTLEEKVNAKTKEVGKTTKDTAEEVIKAYDYAKAEILANQAEVLEGFYVTDDTVKQIEEGLQEAEKVYETFLERAQGHFADTFYEMFQGQWNGWSDLIDKMKNLFFRMLAEMAAKAAMNKITIHYKSDTSKAEAGAGGGGSVALVAAVAAYGYSRYQSSRQKAKERVDRLNNLANAFYGVTDEISESLETLNTSGNEVAQAFDAVNDQFDDYRKSLRELGASAGSLALVESKRREVLEATRVALEEKFVKPLQDTIASLTLSARDYEFYQLDQWYDTQIEKARLLGNESVKVLREAYELSKKQYYIEIQSALREEQAHAEDILATLGMTDIELQVYNINKAFQALQDVLVGTSDEIKQLTEDILAHQIEASSLQSELAAAQARYDQAIADVQAAWEAMGGEGQFPYEGIVGGGDFDPTNLFGAVGPTDQLYAFVDAWDAWKASLESDLPLIETIPGEIDAVLAAMLDLEQELSDLENNLTGTAAAATAAYEAQKQALSRQVTESWQDIIDQLTLSEQELKLRELAEWFDENKAAAEVLGLAMDDLNYAYDLQRQAILDTASASDTLTSALDRTMQSIDDMIADLTGGKYAAVESAEFYQKRYSELLAGGDVQRLLAYIPQYLDFMKAYGGNYAALTASVVADLEALKAALPHAQHGGLTGGLTLAGERGPEWIIPTYEPERSRFLKDVGADPERLGRSIARRLLPVFTQNNDGKDLHITLKIGEQPVRDVVIKGLRGHDTELISATRKAMQ